MKIDYRILWVEDEEDFVRDNTDVLKSYLEDLGFRLEVIPKTSGSDGVLPVDDFQYDLILVDYNLENSETGDQFIELLRSEGIITETLFYSSDHQKLKAARQNLNGTERISFHAGHKGLVEKIKQIINLTIRKVQDVNNMRGLVIAEAIDIETKIKTILISHLSPTPEEVEKLRLKKIENDTERIKQLQARAIEDTASFIDEGFLTFSDLHAVLTGLISNAISKLRASLKDPKKYPSDHPTIIEITHLESLNKELGAMREEVIYLRNTMAHSREYTDQHGKIILRSLAKGETVDFDSDSCAEMRRGLMKHFDHLEKIAAYFEPQPQEEVSPVSSVVLDQQTN